MSDDDEDLFGSSSGDDTDDLIAASQTKPATKKRLLKKTAASKKRGNIPDADNDSSSSDDDDSDGLFDDSDDDDEPKQQKKKKKKQPVPLTKRERLEALQAKKQQQQHQGSESRRDKKKKKNKDDNDKEDKEGGYDSEDSYDSAQYVRTKEDNDFIDVDDDDPDAINELYAEQHFNDERPLDEDGKKKKGRKRGHHDRDDSSDDDDSDTNKEPDNPIMAAVHRMKKKKRTQKKLSDLEEEAKVFLHQMEVAAEEDELAVRERRPATKKLALLPQVTDMLARRDMMRLLLDFDVLSLCRRWIQPLPGGALGNVTVRQRMVEAVGNMTGEQGITANDLKRSDFGKVVMTLYMHKSETPAMKKNLKRLIEQWSRPIFSKSGNMKDLEHAQASRRDAGWTTTAAVQAPAPAVARGRNEHDLQAIIATGSKVGSKEGLNRVRVPFSKGFQFTVRPQSKTGDVGDKRMARGAPVKDTRGNLSKRMVEKGRAVAKNQRSANISIEGRPTK